MQHGFLTASVAFFIVVFFYPFSAYAQDTSAGPSLYNVLKHTYESNPTLMAAREELKERQELYPQARAGWLPSVSANASIYATNVESSNFGNGDGATTKDMSLDVEQPIWRGGMTFAEVARAHDLISVGEATLRQAEQDIFMSAISAYLNTARDRDLLILREKNEEILLLEMQSAQERLDMGVLTQTDLEQAKTRLSRARSQRAQAEADYDISRAEYEEVIGMAPGDVLPAPRPAFNFPDDTEQLVSIAEEQNPEVIMAVFEHKASEHNADAVFRELFPRISAFASMNKQYDPQPGIVSDSETETIGVRATLALFQGGATRSRVREAEIAQKRREYEIEETKRRIRQDVLSNWRSYVSAQVQADNRADEIESAEFALEGVKIEAAEGQRSVLDILDADQELIDARAALINASHRELMAQYALASALGWLDIKALEPQQYDSTSSVSNTNSAGAPRLHQIVSTDISQNPKPAPVHVPEAAPAHNIYLEYERSLLNKP